MPEQSAIGLVHLHAHLFTVGVVGLLDIKGDQAVGVAGGGRFAFEVDADEIEGQASVLVDGFGDHLQTQADQLRNQAPLGGFHLAPALMIFSYR
ncbi:hypothetical protein D3C71_1848680 [compost metagenome]